jgi:hypothetical protein
MVKINWLKGSLVLFILLLSLSGQSWADDQHKTETTPEEIKANWVGYFKKIQSLEYQSISKAVGFVSKQGHIDWKESGAVFLVGYRWIELGKKGEIQKIWTDMLIARDEALYHVLDKDTGVLTISAKDSTYSDPMLHQSVAFSNFEFLINGGILKDHERRYGCFKAIDFLARLEDLDLKKVRPSPRKYKQQHLLGEGFPELICYEFPGGFDSFLKTEFKNFVYFSKENDWMPLAWEKYNTKDELLSAGLVRKWEKSERTDQVTFPMILEEHYYSFTPDKAFEKATHYYRLDVSDVKINRVDTASMSIDPSLARLIWDADKDKTIAVPK